MEVSKMANTIPNSNTPPAQLVEVAAIASRYKGQQDQLMRVLLECQKVVNTFSEDVAAIIAREMGLSQTHVYGFITFYAMLSTKPRGKYIIRMCKSAPCHVRGAREVVKAMEDFLHIKMGETTEDNRFTLEYCECLGICDISPAIMINDKTYGNLTPESARELLKLYIREEGK